MLRVAFSKRLLRTVPEHSRVIASSITTEGVTGVITNGSYAEYNDIPRKVSKRWFSSTRISAFSYANIVKSMEMKFDDLTVKEKQILTEERAIDKVDVCIVGGGPAGLATAIRLKQLDLEKGEGNLRIVVLEKASSMGGHTVSGVILEPIAFRELFPDSEYYNDTDNTKENGIPLPADIVTKVTGENLKFFLSPKIGLPVPEPPQMVNKNKNFIASLSQVTAHLAEKAEELGVEIYPGIAVSDIIYGKTKDTNETYVKGVATKDLGIAKTGRPKANFERGLEFHARQTVFAEGCHGSLTKNIIKQFDLRNGRQNQSYGLGIKEVWEVKDENFKPGFIAHTMGYPLTNDVYGGGFQYHFGKNLVAVGIVVGLDYKNPWVSPYQEFQKLKSMPFYTKVLKDGKCIEYGARALNEGGLQAIPKLYFPGGLLVGASAGFMNVPKIKGTHTAMKSGILAAEEMFNVIKELPSLEELEESSVEELVDQPINLESYELAFKNSWAYKELYEVRNIRPSFNSALGGYGGMAYSGIDSYVFKGRVPWTFGFHKSDAKITKLAKDYKPIQYPQPDGKITFDIMTSVSRTGTFHDEDERCHLRVADQNLEKHASVSYKNWKGIESRFCPAGVYEYVKDEKSALGVKFVINSQNCIHCKTCDIKDPSQDINWEVPEGGDGPKYTVT
ncbi:hypothetical protein TPHA_0N00310 [Tetrapisispora phaffii CBS 4417]|uniref:Electron transfer flavoprotein-ubiquinone oxidoreductase n=1 Tax=Tetrapisispora phaffii (strain ATCC 24235 / CBS 4417 / NBRC 1672 / NRRL Y-8282 / UCD 70-5) TaxID=1071381 RepID=G8C0Y4_TETPH|nr:hypothetical protein TPHA_0N00310 [Tetrapisispora phaffii CBS 4417]CCE65812.1 hypothetical protein TPHA_0N00310 [Tetrapisispora phaffii CBS 4417]